MVNESTSTQYMQKDRVGKTLEEFTDVFTDISNHLIFEKDIIEESQLKDGPTESIYKAADGTNYREQRRDTVKYVEDMGIQIALLGLENQSSVNNDMAIRMMGYDYASYRSQIDQGKHRYPVVSSVLYFGDEKWDKAKSLWEIVNPPKDLQDKFNDYKINLIDVPRLPEEVRDKLTSDFRVVADFFANKDKDGYKPDDKVLDHPEEVLDLFRIFTSDDRFRDIEEKTITKIHEGGEVQMCDFIDRMEQKGFEKGREKEVFDSVFENDYSVERGAEKLNISKDEFEAKYQSWLEERNKQ